MKPKRNGKPKQAANAPAPPAWRNRIVGYGSEPAEQLLANPKNWRIHPQHQQEALSGVLDEVGWVQSVVVNKRTGFVLDGHLRCALAISRGEEVPITYVDLSEAEEALVLASLDPIAALAVSDSEKLNELLGEIDTSNEALDRMLYSLLDESVAATLKDEPAEPAPDQDEAGSQERNLGERSAQIKPVLYVDQIAVFEQALRRTGETNRGAALMMICNAYLRQTEGQFDFSSEGYAPLESVV